MIFPLCLQAMDLFDLGETYGSLHKALSRVMCPVMVIGVQTDILFPVWQQREISTMLQEAGEYIVVVIARWRTPKPRIGVRV